MPTVPITTDNAPPSCGEGVWRALRRDRGRSPRRVADGEGRHGGAAGPGAKEFSARGIRVNAVSPGATRTRLADDAFTRFPEVVPAIAARTAFGRVGEPGDVGSLIAALVGDDGRWITAQDIEVSGGYRL
ncbi:SDR family oxidoreductase [Streptomyces erythrochromogenes]|uniref:SDR family oxidoreductase n=1 Tax=Streptomyces erythrochromogenes TaxID=285574 RepID=UPI0034490949